MTSLRILAGLGAGVSMDNGLCVTFLLEAKKAGYVVPEATLKAAMVALEPSRVISKRSIIITRNNRTLTRRIADKSSIYALYVLAGAGQPDLSLMNFYRTSKSLLTSDSQFLLAGAFALSGDRKTYLELLPPKFVVEAALRTPFGDYDSPIRANASSSTSCSKLIRTILISPIYGLLSSVYMPTGGIQLKIRLHASCIRQGCADGRCAKLKGW